MRQFRIGIIGCGAFAREHLGAMREIPQLRPVAFCDIDVERARELAQEWKGEATDDPQQVISDDSLDAVYICTHHDSHVPLALAACDARRNVLMEKPLALEVDEARRVVDAVDRSGILFMTALKLRFYPAVERLREHIPSPLLVSAQVMDRRWPDDFWAQNPVKGGGNILSQGVHAADLLCHLACREPREVTAAGAAATHPGATVLDTIAATIRFDGGVIGSLVQSDAGETPFASKFLFTVADGARTGQLHDRLRTLVLNDGEGLERYSDEREEGVLRENVAFARALAGEEAVSATARDGLRATALIAAMVEAARSGTAARVML